MTTVKRPNDAEEYLKDPPTSEAPRSAKPKAGPDQKDKMIKKLMNINTKLRTHLKELNSKLEVAIDKTHVAKKPIMPNKEADPEEEQMRIENIKK